MGCRRQRPADFERACVGTVVLALLGLVYPVALIVALRKDAVRDYYGFAGQ